MDWRLALIPNSVQPRNFQFNDRISSAMRDNWVETTLGNVAEVNPKEKALATSAPFAPMDAVNVGKRYVTYFEPRGDRGGARANDRDVLFARIAPCLENGKVAQVPQGTGPCGGSTEFIVLRGTAEASSDFLYFWATWSATRSRATDLMTGTTGRQRLSWTDLSGMKIQLPPAREQKWIVDLVSAVDEYIAALQRQADAARTARNAVLHELLTAGGDDWVETTIGDISDFVSTRHLPAGLGREIPYVGLEHIESRSPRIRDWGTIESVTSHVTPFEPEDVLFGRLRPYLHKVAFAEFPGVCSPEVLVLRATQSCSATFLYLICSIDSTVKACVEMSAGTRMPRTSTSDLASISLWLPPLHEQNRIVAVVSSADDLIHATESAIVESKNLRSGLLSDLLSGEHEIPASYDRLLGAA